MTFSAARLITPPAEAVVSVDEAKIHWNVDDNDHDLKIAGLLAAATAKLEQTLGFAFITQTWQQDFPSFTDEIRLGIGDVIGITTVKYYDTANALQTLSSSVYGFTTDLNGPYLTLTGGESWPGPYDRNDAVRVTWTAGLGPDPADVPENLRQAVLFLGQHWYDFGTAAAEEMPPIVLSLVRTSRRMAI